MIPQLIIKTSFHNISFVCIIVVLIYHDVQHGFHKQTSRSIKGKTNSPSVNIKGNIMASLITKTSKHSFTAKALITKDHYKIQQNSSR